MGLRVESDGSLKAGRYTSAGSSTTLGTSATGVMLSNSWQYISVEITISDTVGVFKVYVDGTLVLNLTGVDTRNGTPTTVDTLQLGHFGGAGGGYVWSFDDVYVLDVATRLANDIKIETIRPSADTAQKQLTPDTGSVNYSRVNEATVDGDTSYVFGSNVNDYDLYDLSDLATTPTVIYGINVISFARKTDAGTRGIYNTIKSGATTDHGSATNLGSGYAKKERIMENNPDIAAPWTYATINSLQVGPRVS